MWRVEEDLTYRSSQGAFSIRTDEILTGENVQEFMEMETLWLWKLMEMFPLAAVIEILLPC